ncbi:MAG: extracellular solute-binding protein [Actinomycetota bacterium]|nr:extracellular solute-binding protein [Actinomycetota bacterium]
MTNKRIRIAATSAVMFSVISACGGVGGGTDTAGGGGVAGAEGPITTQGLSLPDEIAKVRVDAARQATGVDVRINEGAFDPQQFLSSVAADSPPDVVYMDRELIGSYAARGALMPLTDCVAKAGVDMAQYREPAVNEVTLDGVVYALPDFYNLRVLITSDKAATEAGVSPEVSTADWATLGDTAKKLGRSSGQTPSRIGFDPKIPEYLPMWAHANGGALVSADGKRTQLDSPQVVEALEYTTGLIGEQGGWGSFKAFRDSFDMFGERNPFVADQLGSFPMEQWYINTLASTTPDVAVTVTPFLDRQGKPFTWATGNALAIPKGAKHPGSACTFIKTMTEAKTWVSAAKARAEAVRGKGNTYTYTGTYTGNHVADKEIFAEVYKPTGNKVFDDAVRTLLTVQDNAFTQPTTAAGQQVRDAWRGAVNRVLGGEQKPAEALAQAQREAQTALDEANRR